MVLQSKKKTEKGSDDYGVSCDKELDVINIFETINGFFFFCFHGSSTDIGPKYT